MHKVQVNFKAWAAAVAVLLAIFLVACATLHTNEAVEYPYGFTASDGKQHAAWYCRGYVDPKCQTDAIDIVAGWDYDSSKYVFMAYYDGTVFVHRSDVYNLQSPSLFTNGNWTVKLYNQGAYK